MRVRRAEVSFQRKIPAGKFASEGVGLTMQVEIEAVSDEDLLKEIHDAYDKVRGIVDAEIWLSKQRNDRRDE